MAELQSMQLDPTYQGTALQSGFSPQQAPQFNPGQLPTNLQPVSGGAGPDLRGLAQFSKTLADMVAFKVQEKAKADRAYGLQQAYKNGLPMQQMETYLNERELLRGTHEELEKVSLSALQDGAPYEIASQFEKLSGWAKVGYVEGMAKQAGQGYGSWLMQQLEPYMTSDPREVAARTAQLRGYYMEANGLTNLNPALVADKTFPYFQDAEGKLFEQNRKSYAIDQSYKKQENLTERMRSGDIELSEYLSGMASTVDSSGRPLGYRGSWASFEELVKETADAGIALNLDALFDQVDPETGKTYAKRFPARLKLLKEEQARQDRSNYQDWKNQQNMEFDKAEEMVISEVRGSERPYTNAEIDELQKALWQKYGKRSARLEEVRQNYTSDAIDQKEMDGRFEELAQLGLLTPEMVNQAPWPLQQKWGQVAQQLQQAQGPAKQYLDAIEGEVLANPLIKATPDGKRQGNVVLAVGTLQDMFRKRYAELVRTGMPPSEAAVSAYTEVQEYYSTAQKSPGHAMYIGTDPTQKPFPNLLSTLGAASTGYAERTADIDAQVMVHGIDASLAIPGLFLNKQELESLGTTGYFKVPPMVQYYANKYNINPLDIINRQRAAVGLPDFIRPPSLAAVEAQLSQTPRVLGLINRFPSNNRTTRAMATGMQVFDPNVVPGGYGGLIQDAAQRNGIPPNILAGLLETESGWRKEVISGRVNSSAGAQGIAQFMPATAREWGVNPLDPASAIDGAARYLKWLTDQFNGDINMAITAYNGGIGNVRRYNGPIPGNAENQQYLGKVLKAASKFQRDDTLLSQQAVMRGRFATPESTTFDRNQPGLDFWFPDKRFPAVLGGRVKEVGSQLNGDGSGYGNYIVVESRDPLNGQPVDVIYAHLDRIDVREGQMLDAGAILGKQGGTGSVSSVDGTIASVDFLAPAPKGSKSMVPYRNFERLRSLIAQQFGNN